MSRFEWTLHQVTETINVKPRNGDNSKMRTVAEFEILHTEGTITRGQEPATKFNEAKIHRRILTEPERQAYFDSILDSAK